MALPPTIRTFYKFLEPHYADVMVAEGTVRIGTLADYRRSELYGEEIGDRDEGRATFAMNILAPAIWTVDTIPEIAKSKIRLGPNDIVFAENNTFNILDEADVWIYSMSGSYSEEMQARSGYSACVQIDRSPFFDAMCAVMGPLAAASPGIGECLYIGRDLDYSQRGKIPIELLKPAGYAYQQEWRSIWLSREPPAPFVITIPGLIGTCKRIV